MSTHEVHVHLHFYDGVTPDGVTSHRTNGDILTEHTYLKSDSPPPGQEDLFTVTAPEPSTPPKAVAHEQPVAITPQTTHDQRAEIADYSERNKHLVKVDEHLSEANSKEAAAERVKIGRLKQYDEDGLRRKAEKARDEASEELILACGHCALDCAIRGKFSKWSRVHEAATVPHTADQEARKTWRRRLLKNADAHCLPGKTKKPAAKKAA
jgi:hypothetical protein